MDCGERFNYPPPKVNETVQKKVLFEKTNAPVCKTVQYLR